MWVFVYSVNLSLFSGSHVEGYYAPPIPYGYHAEGYHARTESSKLTGYHVCRVTTPELPRSIQTSGYTWVIAPAGSFELFFLSSANTSVLPQRIGDENVGPPDLYRPARYGKPNPIGQSMIGWGMWSQRHPGTILSHPRIRNPSRHRQLRQPGNENGDPRGRNRPARCGNPSTTGRSLMAGDRTFLPAHPGEDRFASPDQELSLIHI